MLDALFILVERSLVQATPFTLTGDGSARYGMLETIRAYANVLLLEEEGQARARSLRCRHLAYYLHLAEHPAGRSTAYLPDDPIPPPPATSCVSMLGDQSRGTETTVYEDQAICNESTTAWLNTLVLEEDNPRTALDFARAEPACVEQGLQLAAALWPFWLWRGALREGRRRLTIALEISSTKGWRHASAETLKADEALYRARARALYGICRLADPQGALTQARAAFEEAAALGGALENI